MTDNGKTLTTGEFSEMTGIAVPAIRKMLRQGRIHGEKHSGKWAINQSECQSPAILAKKECQSSSTALGPIFDTPMTAGKTYDIGTFSKMTYLTEKGVRQWLGAGRLSGSIDTGGNGRVDAANLDRPEFKHLVR